MGTVIRLNAGNRQHDLTIKEFQGQRVVTFRDVDELHQRPNGTARKRFNDNKNRLIHQKSLRHCEPVPHYVFGGRCAKTNKTKAS